MCRRRVITASSSFHSGHKLFLRHSSDGGCGLQGVLVLCFVIFLLMSELRPIWKHHFPKVTTCQSHTITLLIQNDFFFFLLKNLEFITLQKIHVCRLVFSFSSHCLRPTSSVHLSSQAPNCEYDDLIKVHLLGFVSSLFALKSLEIYLSPLTASYFLFYFKSSIVNPHAWYLFFLCANFLHGLA